MAEILSHLHWDLRFSLSNHFLPYFLLQTLPPINLLHPSLHLSIYFWEDPGGPEDKDKAIMELQGGRKGTA